MLHKVVISEKLDQFSDYWNPRIVAELNGQLVKLARLKGEFVWHKHDDEDELFYVLSGQLHIHFRDQVVELNPGEMLVVPKGIEHKPVAKDEVVAMLFEPAETLNTGDAQSSDLTRSNLEKL